MTGAKVPPQRLSAHITEALDDMSATLDGFSSRLDEFVSQFDRLRTQLDNLEADITWMKPMIQEIVGQLDGVAQAEEVTAIADRLPDLDEALDSLRRAERQEMLVSARDAMGRGRTLKIAL